MFDYSYDLRVVRLVSLLLAIGLWSPALVIPVLELQIANVAGLVSVAYLVVRSFRYKILDFSVFLAFIFLVPSWLYAYLFADADSDSLIFVYYIFYSLPIVLAGILIFHGGGRSFFSSFHYAGWVFLFINLLQSTFVGRFLEGLRNSELYSVLHYVDRSALLFPEASGLGQIAALWLSVVFLFYRKSEISLKGFVLAIALYLVCIVTTQSTSSLMLLASLFVFMYLMQSNISLMSFLRLSLLGGGVAFILIWGLTYLYEERGDSMLMSVMNRYSTIFAVIESLRLGEPVAGLGGNYKIVPFVEVVQAWMGIEVYVIVAGINSFVFTRLFEEGWLALLPYVVLALSFPKLIYVARNENGLGLLLFASFVISALLAGYRAYPIMWLQYSLIIIVIFWRPQRDAGV